MGRSRKRSAYGAYASLWEAILFALDARGAAYLSAQRECSRTFVGPQRPWMRSDAPSSFCIKVRGAERSNGVARLAMPFFGAPEVKTGGRSGDRGSRRLSTRRRKARRQPMRSQASSSPTSAYGDRCVSSTDAGRTL